MTECVLRDPEIKGMLGTFLYNVNISFDDESYGPVLSVYKVVLTLKDENLDLSTELIR